MRLKVLCFWLFTMQNLHAFEGCGQYQFRGKLIQEKSGHFSVTYIVNPGTRSQMSFSLSEKNDFFNLMPLLGRPSQFKAYIESPMDGSKGMIKKLTEISLRHPNPLSPDDTGIKKLSGVDCLITR